MSFPFITGTILVAEGPFEVEHECRIFRKPDETKGEKRGQIPVLFQDGSLKRAQTLLFCSDFAA